MRLHGVGSFVISTGCRAPCSPCAGKSHMEQLQNKCLPPHQDLILLYLCAVRCLKQAYIVLPHLAAVLLHAASFLVHGVHIHVVLHILHTHTHTCFTCRYCFITLIITAQLSHTLRLHCVECFLPSDSTRCHQVTVCECVASWHCITAGLWTNSSHTMHPYENISGG